MYKQQLKHILVNFWLNFHVIFTCDIAVSAITSQTHIMNTEDASLLSDQS